MPVADTDFLFSLSPNDKKHKYVINILNTVKNIKVPDIVLFEYYIVLMNRGISFQDIKRVLLALQELFWQYKIETIHTVDISHLILSLELRINYNFSFFDSLVAAATITNDQKIISDDKAFDKIDIIKRIPISRK